MLDSVQDKLAAFGRRIGPDDRAKLDEYVEAIRDVERRLQLAEAQNSRELPDVVRPVGVPESYEAVYAGGSLVRGWGNERSDLDIYVIVTQPWRGEPTTCWPAASGPTSLPWAARARSACTRARVPSGSCS